MTTPAQDLVTTLGPVFSGKFHPSVAPAGTVEPYAVFLLVSSVSTVELDGESADINPHWQVDIFGRDKLAVDALAESAKTAMQASSLFYVGAMTQQDIWEDTAQLYRVLLEFSTWR